jgi:hypothetical protein
MNMGGTVTEVSWMVLEAVLDLALDSRFDYERRILRLYAGTIIVILGVS